MLNIKERLDIADAEISRAFTLINLLWTNEHLGLTITLPSHTPEEVAIRELIVETRIAIMNVSQEIEMTKIRLGLDR
jgi:hypothetical protein